MDPDHNNSSFEETDQSQTTIKVSTERKRKLQTRPYQTTGTLKFSMHSKTPPRKREMEVGDEGNENEDEEEDADEGPMRPVNLKRQLKLDFSSGTMGTKKPLTNPIPRNHARRQKLKAIGVETVQLLPGLLATRPDITNNSFLCQGETLDSKYCPNLPPVKVSVINMDTINAALDLQRMRPSKYRGKPVVVLNMANATTPGGGFGYGALAQEEAICYRSSLIMTLHRQHYPIPDDAVIYSPSIMIIRAEMGQNDTGHELLDFRDPRRLETISVVSCAAVCRPALKKDANGMDTYAWPKDAALMLEKMRVILRNVIRNKHRQVVLGALGCGAFWNPNHIVAEMWKKVLQEPDFQGGWWESVVFAVMGSRGPQDNFTVFQNALDGLVLR